MVYPYKNLSIDVSLLNFISWMESVHIKSQLILRDINLSETRIEDTKLSVELYDSSEDFKFPSSSITKKVDPKMYR